MVRPTHITEADKAIIRARYKLHLANSTKVIAGEYGLSRIRIWQIINNIGNRECPPLPSKSPTRKLPSTSGPKIMNT